MIKSRSRCLLSNNFCAFWKYKLNFFSSSYSFDVMSHIFSVLVYEWQLTDFILRTGKCNANETSSSYYVSFSVRQCIKNGECLMTWNFKSVRRCYKWFKKETHTCLSVFKYRELLSTLFWCKSTNWNSRSSGSCQFSSSI